jgi:hypothetical protein
MRLGVLIIGSLYWHPSRVRCRWRQTRLGCSDEQKVRVPIRYGRVAKSRGNTYTMVFARSCEEDSKLGIGIVVPVRAECCEPVHLVEEAEQLWAAERDREALSGLCGEWGKVCILENPESKISAPVLDAWKKGIEAAGKDYSELPRAKDEAPVLDAATGHALFRWPTDSANRPLLGFDLLLMTATRPDLTDSRYPTVKEIVQAWHADSFRNVNYFFNNRHYGITTFQDDEILVALGRHLVKRRSRQGEVVGPTDGSVQPPL